ncbi:unnamed protein product [Ceutorhynchus assimilis]|uniref:Uncharacterized protein n=1 Tax=Ceutorhynchus assimilis TaxID=467358 RepID=A0A9N9MWY9_9CUCU|nr:unnamed protein product [Ceutorhynchus assimilis]
MSKLPKALKTSRFWMRSGANNNNPYKVFLDTKTENYYLDEDTFKKRGTAFENEYIRKLTEELIQQLKHKMDKERKMIIRDQLEKERKKLEEDIEDMEENENKKK